MAYMRKKTTVYLEPDLLRTAKVWAARTGRKDYEIMEEALRAYLGLDVIESVWAKSDLAEKDALKLAYREIHASRR
jgi:hypothetical protein